MLIVFTGAPAAADYSYAETLEEFEYQSSPYTGPRPWRKVQINLEPEAYQAKYQCDRYGSFLGGCPTLDDPREVPLGYGRPAPSLQGRF